MISFNVIFWGLSNPRQKFFPNTRTCFRQISRIFNASRSFVYSSNKLDGKFSCLDGIESYMMMEGFLLLAHGRFGVTKLIN